MASFAFTQSVSTADNVPPVGVLGEIERVEKTQHLGGVASGTKDYEKRCRGFGLWRTLWASAWQDVR